MRRLVWLWVFFVGGIGALVTGETAVGVAAVGAGVLTLVYWGAESEVSRWLIRAGLVVMWIGGGILIWNWTVEDWAVALRIAFVALGGAALLAYLVRILTGRSA